MLTVHSLRLAKPAMVLSLALLPLFAAIAPARAQIGGLVRRAKDAATKTKDPTADTGNQRGSAAFGAELDETSLTSVLKGLQAMAAKVDERDALRKQQEGLASQLSKSLDQHGPDLDKFNNDTRRVRECQEAYHEKQRPANEAKMRAGTMAMSQMSPAAVQEQVKYSQQIQAAMAKGDTIEMKRLGQKQTDEMLARAGINLHADTAAAIKLCGVETTPAWLTEQERVRADISKLNEQIRVAENDITLAGVSASGMQAPKFAEARERVLHYYLEMKNGRAIQKFGEKERVLLDAHRADIQRVSKAL